MTLEQVNEERKKKRAEVHNELMSMSKEQLVERLFSLGDLLAEGVLKVQALTTTNVILTAGLEKCQKNCPMRETETDHDKTPCVH